MEYGLIGEKLGHSFSKEIHTKYFGLDYVLKELPPEEVGDFLTKKDFKAINVTIPYKQTVIPYLDSLDDNAKNIGAVNTIVCENGKYIGHNTDFAGFMYMIKKYNVEIEGKKVLVLGKGGASKAIIAVLKALNAGKIYTVYYKPAEDSITYEECLQNHTDADVIVNTTPVGMFPNMDDSPIDLSLFTSCKAVLDLIYNPLTTKLVSQARALGMTGATGLEMLVAQAVYASEFFQNKKLCASDEEYTQLIDKITSDISANL